MDKYVENAYPIPDKYQFHFLNYICLSIFFIILEHYVF